MSAKSTGSIPTPDPLKVFLDSSVLFAAALSLRGSARDLIRAAFRDRLRIVASLLVCLESERQRFRSAGLMHLFEPPPNWIK